MFNRGVGAVAILAVLTGCTTSQKSFLENPYKLSDTQVCRNLLKDKDQLTSVSGPDQSEYLIKLKQEIERRSLTYDICKEKVDDANALIAIGVIGAVALGYAASKGGGGGGGTSQTNNNSSYGYAWDAFYDANYNIVWRCRDKSNGRFAYDYNCAGSLKADTTWPSK